MSEVFYAAGRRVGIMGELSIVSQHPLVSIGMPVYNGSRYIREALDSLLAQSYPEFELQISDNASSDETPDICTPLASHSALVS